MSDMIRRLAVLAVLALVGAPLTAHAFDDGDPRPAPPRPPREMALGLGPDLKHFPGIEFEGEFALKRHLSVTGWFTIGYRKESDKDLEADSCDVSVHSVQTFAYGLGAQIYPMGDMENGLLIGLRGMKIERAEVNGTPSNQWYPVGSGLALQATAGWKYTHEVGFYVKAEGGGQVGILGDYDIIKQGRPTGICSDLKEVAALKLSWAGHLFLGWTL